MKKVFKYSFTALLSGACFLLNAWACESSFSKSYSTFLALGVFTLIFPVILHFFNSKKTSAILITAFAVGMLFCVIDFLPIIIKQNEADSPGRILISPMVLAVNFISVLIFALAQMGIYKLIDLVSYRVSKKTAIITASVIAVLLVSGTVLAILRPLNPFYETRSLIGMTVDEAQAKYGEFDEVYATYKEYLWKTGEVRITLSAFNGNIINPVYIQCIAENGVIVKVEEYTDIY